MGTEHNQDQEQKQEQEQEQEQGLPGSSCLGKHGRGAFSASISNSETIMF